MAAPVDAARAVTNVSTATQFWSVNWPAGIVAGDLVLAWFRTANGAVGGPPSTNWNSLVTDSADASDDYCAVYVKRCVGGESGTVTFDFSASCKGAAILWRVTGAPDPILEIEPTISAAARGTTAANSADPGSVAPPGAPVDTLYFALGGGDGEAGAYTGAPTNYGNLQAANSGTGGAAASNCFIGGASRQILASSSDNPGVFTHGGHTSAWTAFTVAIPGLVLIQDVTPIHVGRAMGLGARY